MVAAIATLPGTDPVSAVPALPGQRVLVTGASGFIGSHLAERLLAHGSTVRLLVRRPERVAAMAAGGAEVHTGDLTDPATLRGCCDGIDVVYHAGAWLGTPYTRDAAWAANVAGTQGMVAEARRAGVRRFVHLSSIAVYGPVRTGTVTEAAPLWRGVELYGDSKIAAEEGARAEAARGPELVITRPGMVTARAPGAGRSGSSDGSTSTGRRSSPAATGTPARSSSRISSTRSSSARSGPSPAKPSHSSTPTSAGATISRSTPAWSASACARSHTSRRG